MVVIKDIVQMKTNSNKEQKNFKIMGVQKRLKFIKQMITLEPLVICYVTAKAMIDPALKNLELEKACRVNSHFNNTVCVDIITGTYEQNNFTEENNIVQSFITEMHSWQLTTTNVLAIVMILLLGSFSDRYEIRKPFILFTLFGQLLALSGCILCVQFMNQWPLEVQGFLQEVVYAMFGGEKMLLMVIYAYITDISTPQVRTVRMSIIQALWNICFTIGQSFSAAFFQKAGYMVILSTALILVLSAFLYGVFVIEDSKKPRENHSTKKMVLDAFNPQYILETFKVFSKYKGAYRINIISILVVQSSYSIVNYGETSVMFLFTEAAYEWTVTQYSFYYAITTVTNSFGLFVIVPFFTKGLQLNDLLIVVLSYFSKILTNTIFIAVRSPTGLYIGCVTGILKTLALVGIRSQLTKYVSQNDVGKVLSLYTVIDSFGEGVASQIYNNGIYEYTREVFPQTFLLLGVALHLLGIVILMWMYFRRKVETYTEDTNEEKRCAKDIEAFNSALKTETTYL